MGVVTHDSVDTWLMERDDCGPTVFNRDLKRIRQVMGWAVEQEWTVYNPLLKLKLRPVEEKEIAGGVDAEVVKRMAGHGSDKMMQRYLHFAPDYLRDAVNVLK